MRRENTLTITDASITTVTVDIQVVRIGAKQMTLAVFRQLVYKDILTESAELVAAPWGWVNYDRKSETMMPFVYSHEGALYRSNVDFHSYYDEPFVYRPEKGESYQTEEGSWGRFEGWEYLIGTSGEFPDSFGLIRFESEDDARGYLENWMKSAEILSKAPQLYIAV